MIWLFVTGAVLVGLAAGYAAGAAAANRRWRRLATAARAMPPASQHLKDVVAYLQSCGGTGR